MAGGHPATNRALPTASTQALSDERTRQGVLVSCVYLVVAGSVCEPQTLIPLGAFSSESRAQNFIDHAPSPQRELLGIQRWEIDQPTRDPFWTASKNDVPERARARPLEGAAGRDWDPAFARFLQSLLLENGRKQRCSPPRRRRASGWDH